MTNPDNPRDDRPRTLAELVEHQGQEARERTGAEAYDPLALAPKQVDGLGDEAHFQCVSTPKGVLITLFIPHTDIFAFQIDPDPPPADAEPESPHG